VTNPPRGFAASWSERSLVRNPRIRRQLVRALARPQPRDQAVHTGRIRWPVVRVLVVTNLTPDAGAPGRGGFVRDQVRCLERAGVEVELYSFAVGKRHYLPATREVRRILRRGRFDLVHAHYGLAGWCAALAGARPLVVTFHGTDVRHPTVGMLSRRLARRIDLVAGASLALFEPEGGRPGLPRQPGRTAVLPCGVDLGRFAPHSRVDSRRRLGLDPAGRYLLFPSAPERSVKRHDRAAQLARLLGAELLSGGAITGERMPDWINAASAVLVTSENEGFGLVAVEALACDVPVLSTPVGVAPFLLAGIDGCLAAPFDAEGWADVARTHLDSADPRVAGRERASWFSAELMAERVLAAYRDVLAGE
jgi:teichuronic acid biosynthesis glycosyltransferase TuaC